jgi:hypothetical protein
VGPRRREALAATHSQTHDGGTTSPGTGMSRQEADRMKSLLRNQRGQGLTPDRTQSQPPTAKPHRAPEHERGQDEGRER